MHFWGGLAVGVFSITAAIALWLLRTRLQTGNRHTTRISLERAALHLMPLALGLMFCSEAVGSIRPSQVLWSVLTAIFGFITLCCSIAIIATASELRQTEGGY
jgi:hypothetical protein